MAKDVFISYKSEEFDSANMVRGVLERNGISCWMAPADIPSGSNYAVEVPNAIRAAKVVVFILSEQSQKSEWTQKELDIALNAKKPIMPFALEECDLISPFDFYLGNVQRNDVFQDVSSGLEKLVRDIKALTGSDAQSVDIPEDTLQALRAGFTKQKTKKLLPLIIACAAVVVAAIAAFMLFSGGGNNASTSTTVSASATSAQRVAAEVYASQIGSYMDAGTVNSYENISASSSDTLKVNKAFSILSFVRNQGDAAAQVESVSMEISSLEPVEDVIIQADATVANGDTLLVYAVNNGWGTSKDTEIEVFATSSNSAKRIELSDFATNVELDEARDFEPGDVARPVKAIVDIDKFKAVAHQKKSEYDLDLHVVNKETGDEIRSFSLQWNEREGLHVFYGGVGDAGYSVTLFAVLDVDANPTSIRFSGEQANPRVEDTFRIETVVAPTKSCNVVCKDVYSVNGELQETPEYSVMVTVPVFFDGAFGNQYNLTADLAADPDMGDLQMQRVADKYRYDPQSIFDNRQNKDSGSSTANAGGPTSTSTSADTAATAKAASSETKAASTSETKMSAEEYAEKYPGVKASTPEGFSMRIEPFWGVWATASKDMDEARSFVESARSEAFEAQAFISSDWENLNPETWYVVSLGCSDTEEEANAILTRARKWGYEDAYVKYSGKRL